MAFSMKLWQVAGKDLQEVSKDALDDEARLEEWVVKDPRILGMDVLLIGQQVSAISGARLDLLAMDAEANLVILELKRDKTPREVVAQALDYASWAKNLSFQEIDDIAQEFCGKPLKDKFIEHFGCSLPQTVNASHSMVILASGLDDSSERIVQYLSEQYQVPINVLFFTFFKSAAGEFLGRAWLTDPEELQERTQPRKQAPWSGYYFVNVGEGAHRNWADFQRYGFLSAGQGEKYSNPLKKLKEGDRVFAYMKGLGYVGYGTVTRPAVMVRDFVLMDSGKKLMELPLKTPNMAENSHDPALSEWVVGVKWEKVFTREEAKKFTGIFANQNIVCQLRDPATVDFLKKEFGAV